MGAILSKEPGVKVELIKGKKGVFDVVANGQLIYSKHSAGRFPDDDEIVAAIRSLK